jgi:hypothetical protein
VLRYDTDKAITAIKNWGPTSVKVTCTDGKEVELGIPPKARNRWHRFRQALSAYEWARMEALDGKGKVLGVVENAAVEELVQLDDVSGAVSQGVAEQTQQLGLMLKAQDVALHRQQQYAGELVTGSIEMLRTCQQMVVSLLSIVNALIVARAKEAPVAGDGDGLEGAIVALMGQALSEDGKHKALTETLEKTAEKMFAKWMGKKQTAAPQPTPTPAAAPPKNGAP